MSACAEANPPSAVGLRNLRSPARYRWAMRPRWEQAAAVRVPAAGLPNCGADKRIIAFVTEAAPAEPRSDTSETFAALSVPP
jgi:hypothetical protein